MKAYNIAIELSNYLLRRLFCQLLSAINFDPNLCKSISVNYYEPNFVGVIDRSIGRSIELKLNVKVTKTKVYIGVNHLRKKGQF
ncbi:hypothetical protein BLOT_016418 [Blomia tropicalis]|nr:hypothetical protein BLOT_016418 [Blomia tropicalis]